MRPIGEADGARGAGNLFHRNTMLDIAEPRAAIFLFHSDTKNAEIAELRPKMAWKHIAAVDLIGKRGDFIAGKIADRLPNGIGRFAETEIKAAIIASGHLPLRTALGST